MNRAVPDVVLEPGDADEAAELLRGAASNGLALLVRGHGTRASQGALPRDVDAVFSTARLGAVETYEPGDLTLTVGCGIGLAALHDLLAERGQWLPLQAERRRGTLGGLLATAADGVVDLGYGRPRDLVLGARVALADGLVARARGRVVKNVAGYDVPRLLVGSFGTLGALLEVSLRVAPRPARRTAALLGYASVADALLAAERVREGRDEPVFVDVLAGACEPQLALGFDGSEERVAGCRRRAVAAAERVGCTGLMLLDDDASAELRRRLDDPVAHLLPEDEGARPGVVVRWSGRPSLLGGWLSAALAAAERAGVAVRADARPALGLGFLGLTGDDADALEATAREVLTLGRRRGAAVLLAAPDTLRGEPEDVWGPPPADWSLMERTAQALDPQRVFSCGRFVGGL